MAGEPKRRLFKLLRRTAKTARAGDGRRAEDESALWAAHARAVAGAREGAEAAQRVASGLAKQRAAVDAAQDRARSVGVRAQELAGAAKKLSELFERLSLVALNAGLEGARLGEAVGRSLTLVGDELREHTGRGNDGARELVQALGECTAELGQISAQIDRVREAATDATQDAARAAGASADGERALGEMGERMKKTTGSDPETSRVIAEAAEHARALVTALSQISGKAPRGIVLGALRPMLEPLARLLEVDEGGEGDEATE